MPMRKGVVQEVKSTHIFSSEGAREGSVAQVLACGHAVKVTLSAAERAKKNERRPETRWCYLCTRAKEEADRKARAEKRSKTARAPTTPPITKEDVMQIVLDAFGSPDGVLEALAKMTTTTTTEAPESE